MLEFFVVIIMVAVIAASVYWKPKITYLWGTILFLLMLITLQALSNQGTLGSAIFAGIMLAIMVIYILCMTFGLITGLSLRYWKGRKTKRKKPRKRRTAHSRHV